VHRDTPRGERNLVVAGGIVLFAFAVGWVWSIANARELGATGRSQGAITPVTSAVAGALTHASAPTAAYVTDAALTALVNRMFASERGASGKLRAAIEPSPAPLRPETLPPGAHVEYSQGGQVAPAPQGSGVWSVLLAIGNAVRPVANFNVISLLPFNVKQNGRVGLYYVGTWPSERGKVGSAKAPSWTYANPAGFIEVTPQNADTPVSELAYGEKRRLEIGLALASSPSLLLLDEPLAGMSPRERVETVRLLKSIDN
jgi:hypothetical protein